MGVVRGAGVVRVLRCKRKKTHPLRARGALCRSRASVLSPLLRCAVAVVAPLQVVYTITNALKPHKKRTQTFVLAVLTFKFDPTPLRRVFYGVFSSAVDHRMGVKPLSALKSKNTRYRVGITAK